MHDNCIFCKIIDKKNNTKFLYEDKDLVVINDINPQAPIHLLIIPKKHIRSVNDLIENDKKIITNMIMIGKKMAIKENINKLGYKLLFNVESGGGQVIFHLHLHLMGGWT